MIVRRRGRRFGRGRAIRLIGLAALLWLAGGRDNVGRAEGLDLPFAVRLPLAIRGPQAP